MEFHYYCYTCKNPLQEPAKCTCSAKGNKITTKRDTSEALLSLPGACSAIMSVQVREVVI